jgi:hypothetical protein
MAPATSGSVTGLPAGVTVGSLEGGIVDTRRMVVALVTLNSEYAVENSTLEALDVDENDEPDAELADFPIKELWDPVAVAFRLVGSIVELLCNAASWFSIFISLAC